MQYLAVFAVAAGSFFQAGGECSVPCREDLDALRSDDIRVRESAGLRLAALTPAAVPVLKRLAAADSDGEVRARLTEAVRTICLREGNRLLEAGRPEDALRALASASVDPDLEGLVRRAKKEVEEEIGGWFPDPFCADYCGPDIVQVAAEIRDRYGAWGAAVLMDCLEHQDPRIPAVALLRERDDLLPCLVRALRYGTPALKNEACSALHAMVFFDRKSVPGSGPLLEALRALADDPTGDVGTRIRSRNLLDRLIPGCATEEQP